MIERRALVAPCNELSITRQCDLLGLARSTFYYQVKTPGAQWERLLALVDAIYTENPVYGQRRLRAVLRRDFDLEIGRRRLRRAIKTLSLEAVRPRRNLSKPAPGHRHYPYLLRGLKIESPGQVWATDITYVRLAKGFVYLVAHLDWYSRYVLSWRVSETMDTAFCLESLEEALERYGPPQIHNSDQGAQFTAQSYVDRLLVADVRVSMDGRGRWADNVFIERLWRTVKYEYLFLRDFASPRDVREGLRDYFTKYNNRRPHQAFGYATPEEVFTGKVQIAPSPAK